MGRKKKKSSTDDICDIKIPLLEISEDVKENLLAEPESLIVTENLLAEPESLIVTEKTPEPLIVTEKTPEPLIEIKTPIKKTLNVLFTHISDGKNVDLNNWIIHHLNIGFNHIYILNIENRLNKLFFPDELVTVINSSKNMSLEEVMKQCYNFSSKYSFDWFLYLRSNEYLNLPEDLNTFLTDKDSYDQVMISNRSIVNLKSKNIPNNCSNYYFTFSDMSSSYMNSDLKIFVFSKLA